MEPWGWLVAIVVALLGGGLVTGLAAWTGTPGTIYRDLRAQLEFERDNRRRADAECERMRAELAVVTAQGRELRQRASRLQRGAEIVADHATVGDVLDRLVCCVVVSSIEEGGQLVFVNHAFAAALGRSRAEIIDLGWRRLVHPEDQRSTQAAEGSAWSASLDGFVNRWRRVDGRWVQFRWYSTRYVRGISVSVVRDEGVVGEQAPAPQP